MSTVSGISFAPRAIMNPTQKSTINNNYKNDLNTDSFAPMSFKGGNILKSEGFVEVEAGMKSVTNNLPYKEQFIEVLKKPLKALQEKFITAKCTKDFSIVLETFDKNNAQFGVALKQGDKEIEHINTPIKNFLAKVSGFIDKAEELCPTGGELVKTQNFEGFVNKVNNTSENCTGFIADNREDLLQVIKKVEALKDKIKNADCFQNISIEIDGLNEKSVFPIKVIEKTKGFWGGDKNNVIKSFDANMYDINTNNVLDDAVTYAETHTSSIRDF